MGHTNPDLDDLGLAFHEMGVNVEDLKEYVQYVDAVPFGHHVPKFPVPRDSHLNFLKPGSREVVTRPVHVHEYLPPMHPELENEPGNRTKFFHYFFLSVIPQIQHSYVYIEFFCLVLSWQLQSKYGFYA